MKIKFLLLSIAAVLLLCSAKAPKASKAPKTPDYYVAAVIWPSCHDDSLARVRFWADGEGEWEMIRKGDPRFEGHDQPKVPLWGYEMDNDPKVMEKWIDTATAYGVNTFVFDWYWYEDQPFLESCLNDGFLGAKNNSKMNFYVMWANHNVPGKMWNYHKYGPDCDSIILHGAVTPEIYRKLVDRWITKYFTRPNYVKVDGRPVFWIYDLDRFLDTFGGDLDAAADAITYLDNKCIEAGFKGVYLQANHGYYSGKRSQAKYIERDKELFSRLQIRNLAYYCFAGGNARQSDYLVYGTAGIAERARSEAAIGLPVVPTVSIAWDSTPRYPRQGAEKVTYLNKTPENFKMFLEISKLYLDTHPNQPKLLLINAWNEWIEGTYLLPDKTSGFSYLEAVRDVFGEVK